MDALPARLCRERHPRPCRQHVPGRDPVVTRAAGVAGVDGAQRQTLGAAKVGAEHVDDMRVAPLRDLVHHDEGEAAALNLVVCPNRVHLS